MGSSSWITTSLLEKNRSHGFLTSTFLRLEESRREKVLEAILTESARSGPEHINIKAVAKLAGVPIGSLYQYFGDRETLARFATVLVAEKLSGDLASWIPYMTEMPLREALSTYLSSGIEWSVQEAASLRSFVAAAYGGGSRGSVFFPGDQEGEKTEKSAPGSDWYLESLVRPVAEVMQDAIRQILKAAEARGELKEGIDAEIAARFVNVLLIAVGDARMMPRLDEYYRLFTANAPQRDTIADAIDFICRSVMKEEKGA
jgi:AcrR family transcriptional regulator